jgi:hypothetical protein
MREVALPADARDDLVEALTSRLNDRASFSASAFRAACDGPTSDTTSVTSEPEPPSQDAYWTGLLGATIGHVLQYGDRELLRSTYRDFLRSDLVRGDEAFRASLPNLPPR